MDNNEAVKHVVATVLNASTRDAAKLVEAYKESHMCAARRGAVWLGCGGHTPESGSLGFLKKHDREAHDVVLAAYHAVQAAIYPNFSDDGNLVTCSMEDPALVRGMRMDKPQNIRDLAKSLRKFGYGLLATRLEESVGNRALWPIPWRENLEVLRDFVATEIEERGPVPRLNPRLEDLDDDVPPNPGAANVFVRLCSSPEAAARATASHWRAVSKLVPGLKECMATVGFALETPDRRDMLPDTVFSKLTTLSMAFAASAQGSFAASMVLVSSMGYSGGPLCPTSEREKASRTLQRPQKWDHGIWVPVSLLAVNALRRCDDRDPNHRIVSQVMVDFVDLVESAMRKPVALFPSATEAHDEEIREAVQKLDHQSLARTLDRLCTFNRNDEENFCHLPHLAMMWWRTFRREEVAALCASPDLVLNGPEIQNAFVQQRRRYMLRLKAAAGSAEMEDVHSNETKGVRWNQKRRGESEVVQDRLVKKARS